MSTTTEAAPMRHLVLRAQRAWRQCPDTRALKRELRNGNPYALALLERHGATYENGDIVRTQKGGSDGSS
jgi:hypothetical protein